MNSVESALRELGIEFRPNYNGSISLPCPIHGGDGNNCCIYPDGGWKCFSRGCQDEIGKTHKDFFNYLGLSNVKVTEYKPIEDKISQLDKGWDKKILAQKLDFPSAFYTSRKESFKYSTLMHFQVGAAKRTNKYFGRTCVPVFDITGEYLVGGTFRIHSDKKCPICGDYHNLNKVCYECPKWLHSKGFSSALLYNLHNIVGQKTVIIVEGPGDVWRLFEAGYSNAVAIFGNFIKNNQIKLLQHVGVESIIDCLDSDAAGMEGKEKLNKLCGHLFNIKSINLPQKDFGAMTPEQIRRYL